MRSILMPSVRSRAIDFGALFAAEEGGGDAVPAGAACASDAVNEILRDVRQVVVNHVRDVLDVNAAGSEVGGYQDAVAPLLESREGGDALRLRAAAVNHGSGEAVAVQGDGQALGSALGAREDEAAAGFLGEQAMEQRQLAIGGDFESLLAHIFGRFQHGTECETHRVLHVVLHEMRDGSFERRGKAHRLPVFRQDRCDSANRRKKSHIEHAIGFVENQNAQIAKMHELARKKIFEPSGGGDHQACAFAQSW